MTYHSHRKRDTHVNDNHLDFANDQHSVFEWLRDVHITVGHIDGLAPTAVDTFVTANVLLHGYINTISRFNCRVKS